MKYIKCLIIQNDRFPLNLINISMSATIQNIDVTSINLTYVNTGLESTFWEKKCKL